MNKEQQDLLDKVYDNYRNKKGSYIYEGPGGIPTIYTPLYINGEPQLLTKEEFINKCKTDKEFSEKWGLKVEERELSEDERYDLCVARKSKMTAISEEDYIKYNIPTKLITLTYNNNCDMKKTTDKNGSVIKVGDYVKVVNRITGSVEDSGVITKIEGRQVHLGAGYVDGKLVSLIYLSDQVIKK